MTLLALLSPIASLRGLDYDNIDYLYPEDISHSITPQLLSSFCHFVITICIILEQLLMTKNKNCILKIKAITPAFPFCHYHCHHNHHIMCKYIIITIFQDQKQNLHPEDISHHSSHTEHSDAEARERSVN